MFRALGWPQFTASEPFDLICLARSPEYTPATCHQLFDAIRDGFIDEDALRVLGAPRDVSPVRAVRDRLPL